MKILLLESLCLPIKHHETDAGIDLKSKEDTFTLLPKERRKIGLGIRVEIPEGYFGMLVMRSGVGSKTGLKIANGTGIIDSDYRGEVMAVLENSGENEEIVEQFKPIVQMIVIPCSTKHEIVEELSDTNRGEGGFGSTDYKV